MAKRTRSLIRESWLIFTVSSLFFVCFSIVTCQLLTNQMTQQAEKHVDFIMQQTLDNVYTNMSMLNNISFYLIADSQVQDAMSNENASSLQVSQMESRINSLLTYNPAWSKRFVRSLFLFKMDDAAYAALRESAYASVQERHRQVFENYHDYSSIRKLIRPEGSDYCYYMQDYLQINFQQYLGKIIIEIDPNNLIGVPMDSTGYSEAVFFLSTSTGEILCSSDELNGHHEDLGALYAGYRDASVRDYYHIQKAVPGYDLQMEIFLPYESFMGFIFDTQRIIYILSAILLLVFLGFSIHFTRLCKLSFGQFSQDLAVLASGDFSVRMGMTRYRELNEIALSFNVTGEKLGELFQRIYEMGTLLNQAEYQMLESQINPHFIMNILETINMSCLMANQPEISRMVVNLGMLLRCNVVMKKKQIIPLEQELEYTRYYLDLQKNRFENLHYEIDVEDPALLSTYLPKLTIQPIVENSVVHGLENTAIEGMIYVYIWSEDRDLLVRVKDNGIGFDAENLDMSQPAPEGKKGSHIALRNIQRRIELLYGSDYGLTVHSVPGRGTEVLITLPIDVEGEKGEIHPC